MTVNVYDKTQTPGMLDIAGSITSIGNINILKYFSILKNESIIPAKVTNSINGSYRVKVTDEGFLANQASIQTEVEGVVSILVKDLTHAIESQGNINHLTCVLNNLMRRILAKDPSGATVAFLDMIDNKMIYMISLLTRNLINFEITLDNFVEDWAECKEILESKALYDRVINELNLFVQDILISLKADGLKLDILEVDDTILTVFTLMIAEDVIFTNGIFNMLKFKRPGVVKIDITKPEWQTLSSITNQTRLSYYKLYNNNYSRFDNCVSVYFCKVDNTFLLYI